MPADLSVVPSSAKRWRLDSSKEKGICSLRDLNILIDASGPRIATDFYVKPQLTYRDDRPGRRLPALHFTFRVTKS